MRTSFASSSFETKFLWTLFAARQRRIEGIEPKNGTSTSVSYDSCIFHRVEKKLRSGIYLYLHSLPSLGEGERERALGRCTWLCPVQCISRHVHRTVHRLPRSRAREFCINGIDALVEIPGQKSGLSKLAPLVNSINNIRCNDLTFSRSMTQLRTRVLIFLTFQIMKKIIQTLLTKLNYPRSFGIYYYFQRAIYSLTLIFYAHLFSHSLTNDL